MYYYPYNPTTKELILSGDQLNVADLSPLEKDVYHYPANSTLVEPKETKEYEINVFDEELNKWVVLPDYRNAVIFCTDKLIKVKILDIGVTPKDVGATLDSPPSKSHSYVKETWVLDDNKLRANVNNARLKALENLDRKTDQFYFNQVGNRQAEYAEAFAEAVTYLEDRTSDQPMVASHAEAKDLSMQDAANDIIRKANNFKSLQSIVRQARQHSKVKINTADSEEKIDVINKVFDFIITDLSTKVVQVRSEKEIVNEYKSRIEKLNYKE